jgi:hypothetical protein
LRAGLFFKSFGTGLIIFAVSAVLLFDDPRGVALPAFLLGAISVIGSIQFREARRREKKGQLSDGSS